MSDYTSFQLTIYDIPKGKTLSVADLVNEHGLSGDWETGIGEWDATSVHNQVATGEPFTETDYRVGNSTELAEELAFLKAPFMCWEDPKYGWPGTLHMYHPDLGLITRECDANGNAVLPYSQIRAIDALPFSNAEKWQRVLAFYGVEWEKKFAELNETLKYPVSLKGI